MTDEELLRRMGITDPVLGPRPMYPDEHEQDARAQPGAILTVALGWTPDGRPMHGESRVRIDRRDGRYAYATVLGPERVGAQVVIDVFDWTVEEA